MKDLDDQLFVVAGATGNVGEGIVRSLLGHGGRVAAIGRDARKLRVLREQLAPAQRGRLIDAVGDIGTFDGAADLVEKIAERHGAISHGVASLGDWWRGRPAWEVTEAEFDRFYVGTSRLHFASMRAIVPRLSSGGSYTMLAGLSAIKPIANLSLIGMQAAAQVMLGREVQIDADDRVRIYNLVLGFVINRARPDGDAGWLRADEVGDIVARLAASGSRGRLLRADDRDTAEASLAEAGA